MSRVTLRIFTMTLMTSLFLNLFLLPILVNEYLRFTYLQTLAHWQSKLISPPVVFVGDSITAGGRSFNDGSGINLATNGLQTYQIAAGIDGALAYHPEHIVVMVGTNDAIEGPINYEELVGLWTQICTEPSVVVTLAPPSRDKEITARVDEANAIALEICTHLGRPVLTLDVLRGSDGLIQPQYTSDGTHLTEAAYQVWRDKLEELGI